MKLMYLLGSAVNFLCLQEVDLTQVQIVMDYWNNIFESSWSHGRYSIKPDQEYMAADISLVKIVAAL